MLDITPIEIVILDHADGTGTAEVYAITPAGRTLLSTTELDWQQMYDFQRACPDETDDLDA